MDPLIGKTVVGVHIGRPVLAPNAACPAGNTIGGLLLRRVIELALLREGDLICEGWVSGTGELNDFVCLLFTGFAPRTIEVIKRELADLALLECSQIGFRADGAWHCVHPSESVRIGHLLDPERQALVTEKTVRGLRVEIELAEMAAKLKRALSPPPRPKRD